MKYRTVVGIWAIVIGFYTCLTGNADVIGINFQGNTSDADQTLASGDAAGVVATGNWNNVAYDASPNDLIDASGSATTADLVIGGQPGAYSDYSPTDTTTVNHKLLNGGIRTPDNLATQIITATITDLPAALTAHGYDLYVYTFSDGFYGSTRGSDLVQVDLGNSGVFEIEDSVKYNYTSAASNFDGTLSLATGGSIGEYVKFSGVGIGMDSVQIKVSVAQNTRAFLNGIQIVSTTVPSNVTVVASDATATEGGADTAVFLFGRTGDTSAELTVNYSISGTASNGNDYATLNGQAVIPAGASIVDLTIAPVDDTETESPETVTLTLLSGSGYVVGAISNATATIIDNDTPATIGINVHGGTDAEYILGDEEYAGATLLPHWNNLQYVDADIGLASLIMCDQDRLAQITSAGAFLHEVYDGTGYYKDDETPDSNSNAQLLGSGANGLNGTSAGTLHLELSVTNLPTEITTAGYNIYVYGFMDGFFGSTRGSQTVELDLASDGSIDAYDTYQFNYTNEEANYDGELTLATAGSIGEYIAFTEVGKGVNSFKMGFRNATVNGRVILSGVQIIGITPPPTGTIILIR